MDDKKRMAIRSILTRSETRIFEKLNSPSKIQDYLNTVPFNHEHAGETYMSPRRMLTAGTAHCFEGALFAAAALMYHGHKPLLMDLQTARGDQDHVVALFKEGSFWGAISKTNHAVLRYRDPVYIHVRELALSYFNEYFLDSGKKTLRAYSDPFDLSKVSLEDWFTQEYDLYDLVNNLNDARHHEIVSRDRLHMLRNADEIEIAATRYEEWSKKLPTPSKKKS